MPIFGSARHVDTAVADGRVSVGRPHGSPDGGQFRRFRVAEDNSACNSRRRLEISEISGPSPILSIQASQTNLASCRTPASLRVAARVECGDDGRRQHWPASPLPAAHYRGDASNSASLGNATHADRR